MNCAAIPDRCQETDKCQCYALAGTDKPNENQVCARIKGNFLYPCNPTCCDGYCPGQCQGVEPRPAFRQDRELTYVDGKGYYRVDVILILLVFIIMMLLGLSTISLL